MTSSERTDSQTSALPEAETGVCQAGNETAELRRENEALKRELAEAREQQDTASEILQVISSSPTDLQWVLDTVAQSAARLCDAADALIFRVKDERLKVVAQYGSIPSPAGDLSIIRDFPAGRAIIDRCVVYIPDVLSQANSEFPQAKEFQQRTGMRSVLVAPLLREGVAIGAIAIRRTEVR